MPASPPSLAARIADLIRRDLVERPREWLEPIGVLGAKYGASRPTITKALRLLQAEGLIQYRKGSKITVVGRGAARAESPRRSSAEVLFRRLREDILRGAYQIGEELPKQGSLAGLERISTHTVKAAYDRLVKASFAHRRGKKVLAGSGPAPSASRAAVRSPPVILILSRHHHAWANVCDAPRTARFGRTVVDQAATHGIALLQVNDQAGKGDSGLNITVGMQAADELIHRLGYRYRGTVIASNAGEIPGLAEWIELLLRHRKPVVWFDKNDDGLAKPIRSAHFIRCHYSELGAAEAALRYLARYGHRRAAYAYGSIPWHGMRKESLARSASRLGGPAHVAMHGDPDTWGPDDWEDGVLGERLRALKSRAGPLVGAALDQVSAHARKAPDTSKIGLYPALARCLREAARRGTAMEGGLAEPVRALKLGLLLSPILSDPGLTAIIAPNDAAARVYLRWLAGERIEVPRRISLISFDNDYAYTLAPPTTVDFGFGELGYKAFHAILGAIPVERGPTGDIAAIPFVVDKGSVRQVPDPGGD